MAHHVYRAAEMGTRVLECGNWYNMAPLRGWGLRGQRLDARVPHGHWKTLTFIAALRHDRIDAPWVIDGPINGELFATYVEQVLVPTLAAGDIVILDTSAATRGTAHGVPSGPQGLI